MSKVGLVIVQAAILGAWVAGSLLLNRFICKMGHRKSQKNRDCFVCDWRNRACAAALIMPKDPMHSLVDAVSMLLEPIDHRSLFSRGMGNLLPKYQRHYSKLLTSARLLIAAMS